MTRSQEKKINQIREELETIAADNDGILNRFDVEPMNSGDICVHFRITSPVGTIINFEKKHTVYASETVFVGIRGGVTYINYRRKNCPVRPVRNIMTVFRKDWVHAVDI